MGYEGIGRLGVCCPTQELIKKKERSKKGICVLGGKRGCGEGQDEVMVYHILQFPSGRRGVPGGLLVLQGLYEVDGVSEVIKLLLVSLSMTVKRCPSVAHMI